MYLGPALLGEFVSTYKQMVDIVGREAVGACILLIKLGQQQWELKASLKNREEAGFKMRISEQLRSRSYFKESYHPENLIIKITIK